MTDKRYPDFDDEPQGDFDKVLRIIADSDEPHVHKAMALAGMARKEYEFAKEDGEDLPPTFAEFADQAYEGLVEESERLSDE